MDINILKSIYSVISGVLLGIAVFFVKIASSSGLIILFFINPFTWLAGALGTIGFVLMQKSFYYGNISKSIPIIAGLSIIIPVISGYAILKEAVGMGLIGVLLIAIGILFLAVSNRKT